MDAITRRKFLKQGSATIVGLGTIGLGGGFAGSVVGPWLFPRGANGDDTPTGFPTTPQDHFFIHVFLQGGADNSCLFDGRPLEMTAAKLQQNYSGIAPELWTGANGTTAWASPAAMRLAPLREHFSVVNGMHMAASFDGHDQNANQWLAGDPFGGECFIPHLSGPGARRDVRRDDPLDFFQSGSLLADLTNVSRSLPLPLKGLGEALAQIRLSEPINPSRFAIRAVLDAFARAGTGAGSYSEGARKLDQAYRSAPELARRLSRVRVLEAEGASEVRKLVDLSAQLFRERVTRAVLWAPEFGNDYFLDAHDESTCRKQPATLGKVSDSFAELVRLLGETPWDEGRSLRDVTTFVVTSEFSRTMRQKQAKSFEETGTDHNPLNNTVLIGGKGIRGNLVVGASDWATSTESLSGAHREKDVDLVKAMGRPFDFATSTPRLDRPAAYRPGDYLTSGSVVNTIYDLFGVATAKYRKVERNGAIAPSLPILRG